MRRILRIAEEEAQVWLTGAAEGYRLQIGERAIACALRPIAGRRGAFVLEAAGQTVAVRIAVDEDATFVHLRGRTYEVRRADPADAVAAGAAGAASDHVLAPMPGVVVSLAVRPGEAVAQGAPLVVIESMKLETTLKAPRDGVVETVAHGVGDSFALRDVLVTLAPQEAG